MSAAEITFGTIMAVLALGAIVVTIVLAKRAERRHVAASERGRFVWTIDVYPGSHGHLKFVLRNTGTDTAEDVVLLPGPGRANPEFRELPNGATIHGLGSHDFYCDLALSEVLPREMLLSWRDHKNPRLIALPTI
jgi:hypothetical protein